MGQTIKGFPEIKWNNDMIHVSLPIDKGQLFEASWKPNVQYVVQLRETDSRNWSFGVVTPLTHCGFNGLTPDTEYDMEVRTRIDGSESDLAIIKVRTNPAGELGSQN